MHQFAINLKSPLLNQEGIICFSKKSVINPATAKKELVIILFIAMPLTPKLGIKTKSPIIPKIACIIKIYIHFLPYL